MRRILFTALLLAPGLVMAQSAFERHYGVRVDVDAQGRVARAETLGDVPEELVPAIERAASATEFEPATRAGVAVDSSTTLKVTVRYDPVGRNYRAKVARIEGYGGLVSPPPPVYPTAAVKQGYGARVVARLSFRADGSYDPEGSRIESVDVVRIKGEAQPQRVAEFDQAFREELLEVLPKWRYSPDVVAGQGVAATVLVPVVFCPPDDRSLCRSNRPLGSSADSPAMKVPVPLDSDLTLAAIKPAVADTGS